MGSDSKLGYTRDEIHCSTCGGHLGHLFNDGPAETTGKRHCINGDAMNFIPETKSIWFTEILEFTKLKKALSNLREP